MNTHVQKASQDFDFNDAWAFIGSEQASRRGNSYGNRLGSALIRAKDWLIEHLRPIDPEEAFLARSQNLADLERRIRMVQNPECQQFPWRS